METCPDLFGVETQYPARNGGFSRRYCISVTSRAFSHFAPDRRTFHCAFNVEDGKPNISVSVGVRIPEGSGTSSAFVYPPSPLTDCLRDTQCLAGYGKRTELIRVEFQIGSEQHLNPALKVNDGHKTLSAISIRRFSAVVKKTGIGHPAESAVQDSLFPLFGRFRTTLLNR